jgi:tryptophan 2,3-dioxygenase
VTDEGVYYGDYLQLGKVLDAQHLASDAAGRPAHDEMLFIIVHQAFELWFKQILWELDAALVLMRHDRIDERDIHRVVGHLERIRAIQPLLIQQISILETMTPLDFLDFRDLLVPASGGQSKQFRLIENRLGLDAGRRLKINGQPYTDILDQDDAAAVSATEVEDSMLSLLDAWLSRMPFLQVGEFSFWETYRDAVAKMLAHEVETIKGNAHLDDEALAEQLKSADNTAQTFATLFDEERYDELLARGERRLSQQGFLAALLISLHRDEPILHSPWRILALLIDIDEGFTGFRQRHVLLAHRMLGTKMGTGGTSGHKYLAAAAAKHAVFRDLFELSTFQIPRSKLPPLPDDVRSQMQFRFSQDHG